MYFVNRLNIEWQILELLHKLSSKFMNYFAFLISYLGSGILLFAVIAIVYFLISKKQGRLIGLVIAPSMVFNNILKTLFSAKRPFEFSGKEYLRKLDVKMDQATGTSFPSGHAQISSATYSEVFINFKKIWLRIICVAFIVLIAFSRLYLGVHFPGDVLVGLILGIGLSVFLHYMYAKIEDKNYKYFIYLIPLVITIPFIIINFNNPTSADLFKTFGFASAFTLSMFIEEKFIKFKEDVPFKNKLLRLLLAAVFGLLVYASKIILPSHNFFQFLRYFLVTITSFMIVPFFFKKEGKE